MDNLLECVPNFSEGRDVKKINDIVASISSAAGVRILNVDMGKDANRTVVTIVGQADYIGEAAFRGIKAAAQLIDMRHHTGAHPRIGATDVCPLVPLGNATMDQAVKVARSLARRVGEELNIPVYLYQNAAVDDSRRNLAQIRRGQYEGLAEKMVQPKWKPDFGPNRFPPQSGATVIGARPILIAFNLNLDTQEVRIASKLAGLLRESGYLKKGPDGTTKRIPGMFRSVKAIGWYMEKYQKAQVSMNLTEYQVSPPHRVYESCKKLAEEMGVKLTGSELIGMIPLAAMLQAGEYYAEKAGVEQITEAEKILLAVQNLGLDELRPFKPVEKILEYGIEINQDWLK